jgi:hypothetical protein
VQHAALFEAVGNHIVRLNNLASFNSQDLANFSWAYATLNQKHPQLFQKIGDFIIRLNDLSAFNWPVRIQTFENFGIVSWVRVSLMLE